MDERDQHDQNWEMNNNEHKGEPPQLPRGLWLIVAIVALVVAGLAFAYGREQQSEVSRLSTQEAAANATITDLKQQLGSMSDKLNAMVTAQQQQQTAQASTQQAPAEQPTTQQPPAELATKPKTPRSPRSARSSSADKRYKSLQAQLAEEQKQLKETQEQVAKNRTDLEGSLNSTRDELNGSIAKTHEEVVALAKRGERNYFEFDLDKTKNFERVGPLSLSLRKADTKHKSFDLDMIVDDDRLSKKKVNLYEPVWIHTENDSQPVQVVANRIEKNHIHGYVSAPKYRPSELATVSPVAFTPAANQGGTPNSNIQNSKPADATTNGTNQNPK